MVCLIELRDWSNLKRLYGIGWNGANDAFDFNFFYFLFFSFNFCICLRSLLGSQNFYNLTKIFNKGRIFIYKLPGFKQNFEHF